MKIRFNKSDDANVSAGNVEIGTHLGGGLNFRLELFDGLYAPDFMLAWGNAEQHGRHFYNERRKVAMLQHRFADDPVATFDGSLFANEIAPLVVGPAVFGFEREPFFQRFVCRFG